MASKKTTIRFELKEKDDGLEEVIVPKPWIPKGYMKRAVRWLLEHGGAGLLLDPGLGKTSIAMAAFKILLQEGIVDTMLVIAPLRPCWLVWPKERAKWTDFKDLTMTVLHGKDKDRNLAKKFNIYVINPDGLSWLLRSPLFKARFQGAVLCVDESSKFRHVRTQRFKMLKPVLSMFRRRWILTGSPAPRNLLDLFGQIFILDLGAALGAFITHYKDKFFEPSGYGGFTWVPRKGARQEIQNALKPLCLRMSAEDYLKLPPIVGMIGKDKPNITEVELPRPVMVKYKQMENLFLTQLRNGEVTAANAAVASGKCRQIASGGLYFEGKHEREWEDLHDAKLEAVADLLEELEGQPTLIAYEFEHDLARLKRLLGDKAPYIGGGVSTKQSLWLEREWNRGNLPYLLVNPSSAAWGLNLQEAGRAVIWHTLTWNYEFYDQMVRRIWRQGQTNRVFVYHLIVRGTVEEAMMRSLRQKCTTQKQLLNALKVHYNDLPSLSSQRLRGMATA